jgi:hypothetical protein
VSTGDSFSPEKRKVRPGAGFLDHQEARSAQGLAFQPGDLRDARRVLRRHLAASLPSGHIAACSLAFSSAVEQHAAGGRQGEHGARIHGIEDHHAVLRGATGGIVEGLGAGDRRRRFGEIGRGVDDAGDIAGADAEGRRAAGIGRAHVGLRTGGHHQVGLPHQRMRRVLGDRRGQHLHQVFRRADFGQFGIDVADQRGAGRGALGRGRDDHRIAALERVDDLVGRRGAGVGRGRDRRHHADRARDLDDAALRVLGDDADALRALEVAQQAQGLAVVLGDLVLDHAEARVAHRHFGQRPVAAGFHDGPAGGRDHRIDAGLVPGFVATLRGARRLDQG